MPTKPPRPCRQPGCPALTDSKRGYCDKHSGDRDYKQRRTDEAEQSLYTSTRWRKLRALKLQENPFCELCLPKIAPATIVHHKHEVKQGGDPFEWDNLQSVCASCHRREHG